MTDETPKAPDTDAAPASAAAPTSTNPLSGKSKAFWAGVGIGSAAIVAAAMYARRPKKKK